MTKETIKQKEELIDTAVVENVEVSETEEVVAAVEKAVGKVGSLLKEKRMSLGLEVVDIAQKLCIRRVYLEAIEESRYSELPEFPYGIGFIRSYADFLGLNGHRIVQVYKDETEANDRINNDYFVFEPQAEVTAPNHKYVVISLLFLIVLYAAWKFTSYSNNNEEAYVEENAIAADMISENNSDDLPLVVENTPTSDVIADGEELNTTVDQVVMTDKEFVEPVVTVVTKTLEVVPTVVVPSVSVVKDAVKNNYQGYVVSVDKETWVEVKNADKLYLSKVLNAGDTYNIPQEKGMILSVGKVRGVNVTLYGKKVDVIKPNKKMNISLEDLKTLKH